MARPFDYNDITLLNPVGEGGFADVYKANYFGQIVAVKRWKFQALPADHLELFRREVEVNRMCNHPNVVRFIGASTSPICIVTEFVDGCNLYDLVHDPRMAYTWGHVRQIALDMAAGMEHLHSQRIIHRDLKSLNILISRDFHAKICDFGLSRLVQFTLRLTGGRGTVHWMAPEVIEHSDYNDKADVYSYGICLWELVSRCVPYADIDDEYKIAEAVLMRDHRPTIPASTPPEVAKLIRACWDPRADNRPNMQQIVQYWAQPGVIPEYMINQPVGFQG